MILYFFAGFYFNLTLCMTKLRVVLVWRKASVKHFFVDVDERREAALIHDNTRCQDTREFFIMSFAGVESSWVLQASKVQCLLFIFVFCLFAGLWGLKFTIQWRWTFELALVMEHICCCNWVDSWMRNVDHIATNSLVLEMGGKQTKANNGL